MEQSNHQQTTTALHNFVFCIYTEEELTHNLPLILDIFHRATTCNKLSSFYHCDIYCIITSDKKNSRIGRFRVRVRVNVIVVAFFFIIVLLNTAEFCVLKPKTIF